MARRRYGDAASRCIRMALILKLRGAKRGGRERSLARGELTWNYCSYT